MFKTKSQKMGVNPDCKTINIPKWASFFLGIFLVGERKTVGGLELLPLDLLNNGFRVRVLMREGEIEAK